MTGEAKKSWQRLCEKFNAEVSLPNQDILALGHLYTSMTTKWLVRVNAGPNGLRIRRSPWFFLFPKICVRWSELESVNEYGSRLRHYESTKSQSNCIVKFVDTTRPLMMVPWCTDFNKFLPDSVELIDNKHVHWQSVMLEFFDMRH